MVKINDEQRGEARRSAKTVDEPFYPIRVVARRTGLSPHVIRVWERRYGAVTPRRADNGYRQYSESDVDRLRCLRELTDAGHGIGDVAELPAEELADLLAQKRAVIGPPPREAVDPDDGAPSDLTVPVARASLARAVEQWDADELRSILREAAVRLPLDTFLEEVLFDLLRQVGRAWEAGQSTPAREHMISSLVPDVLSWVGDRLPAPEAEAPLMVLATPAGTRHDLGARVADVVARSEGWRTLFLGADLPAEEIDRAARENDADLVGLSVIYPPADPVVAEQIAALAKRLPAAVGLVLGGAAAPSYLSAARGRPEVTVTGDLSAVRARLSAHS